jgi:hypothetical protein
MTRRRPITPPFKTQEETVTEAVEIEVSEAIIEPMAEIEEEKEVEVEAIIEPVLAPEPELAPVFVAPVPPRAPIPPVFQQEDIQRRNIPRFSKIR